MNSLQLKFDFRPRAESLAAQIDLAGIVGESLPLLRCGSVFRSPCPFCGDDSDEETFSVDASHFFCSVCGREGTAVDWLRLREATDLSGAADALASRLTVASRAA